MDEPKTPLKNETEFPFGIGIEWSNCTAFTATSTATTLLYPYPPAPPGWPDPPIPGINEQYMHASICQRVHWGPYERGPVFTLFESLAGPIAPDPCLEGPYHRFSHLATLWISDPEIAAYINTTLDIPVHIAEYDLTETRIESFTERKWTWSLPGQADSEISIPEVELHAQPSRFIERVFWHNATTLSYLDLNKTYEVPTIQPHLGYGRMEEPMAAASSGIHEYATTTDSNTNANWTATVHQFKDYECEEPL